MKLNKSCLTNRRPVAELADRKRMNVSRLSDFVAMFEQFAKELE
ncbi:MAG: hypothetical protein V3T64_11765 [Myxococcota bacterium]